MTFSASGALAVELRPHPPGHWAATYYPMVHTLAGRWADVTRALHEHLLPATEDVSGSSQWIEMRSPDPEHHRGIHLPAWGQPLAAGYLAALAVYDGEDAEEPLPIEHAQQLREATVVVPTGQLSEWVLDGLQDETSHIPG
ncbi:hypothetical protein [Kocuria aegyptia]|uniref:Uncharacterized protein n=1 Tax=Kocuria aegyptia TaxID=330943 RepID=A0ABN2K939_9MICC